MLVLHVPTLGSPVRPRVVEVPDPDPGDRVLIAVTAAGLGFPDLLLARGGYQVRPEPPFVPGMEVTGRVLAAPDASWVGRRVVALTGVTGGCAELVAVRSDDVYQISDTVPDEVAGGFVVNFHTAWFALTTRAGLRAGETVLVHGAGGGLGQAVCSVAAALGARVVATAGTKAKAAAARTAGATEVVLTSEPDWADTVRRAAGPVNVVVDPVGGGRFDWSLRLLAPLGRLVVVGFASGDIPEVRANRVLLRNISVMGAAWREYTEFDPAWGHRAARALDELLDSGRLRPMIGRAYAWDDAADAFADLENPASLGRLVVLMPETCLRPTRDGDQA